MKKFRTVVASLVLLVTLGADSTAEAAPLIRFWRGFKLSAMSDQALIDGLNQTFIPWTAGLGTTRAGMIGYLPVIPPQLNTGIADEFALVVYESEDQYKAFRATPDGQRYSEAHWNYFDQSTSKSAVAHPLGASVEFGNSYIVTPYSGRWDVGYARFTMIQRAAGLSDAEYLKKARAWLRGANNEGVDDDGSGHYGRIALIENDYVATYDLWSDRSAYLSRNDNSMDSPDDFADYYAGAYGLGRMVFDTELAYGLRNLERGSGIQAPIAE